MRIRGATSRDLTTIENMLKEYNFKVTPKHIEMLVVVEDNEKIIAASCLTKQLEAVFMTDMATSKSKRVEALTLSLKAADVETINLGYDSYHAMNVKNSLVVKTLKKHFGFKDMVGSNLIKIIGVE